MDNYTLAMGDAFRNELDKIAKCGPGKVRSGRRPVRAATLLKKASKAPPKSTFRKVGPHVVSAVGTLIGVDQIKKHYKAHKIGRQYQKQMKQQRG